VQEAIVDHRRRRRVVTARGEQHDTETLHVANLPRPRHIPRENLRVA
jgi:hypothetical protein